MISERTSGLKSSAYNDYDGTVNDLNYCDDDANDFVQALTGNYGWDSSHIYTLIDTGATKDNILAGILRLATKAKPSDEVVFFYSEQAPPA